MKHSFFDKATVASLVGMQDYTPDGELRFPHETTAMRAERMGRVHFYLGTIAALQETHTPPQSEKNAVAPESLYDRGELWVAQLAITETGYNKRIS